MTAEVAVLNKFGVALAADSAVTVDHWHNNKTTTKIYNSANKLFALSKFAPVGVMFYNAVGLGGIPWETLVKVYRNHLHNTKLDTVDEYCSHFFSWLNSSNVFSDGQIKASLRGDLIRTFVRIEQVAETKSDFLKKLDEKISELQKLEDVDGFDDAFMKNVCQQYRDDIDMAVSVCFKKSHINGHKRKIDDFTKLLLRKKRPLPYYAGIVIAGFGELEALPRLREFTVDAVISGKVRFWQKNAYTVDQDNGSEVVPLADSGVIKTLIEGISPDFENAILEGTIELILGMPKQILDPITELTDIQKKKYVADAADALKKNFRAFYGKMVEYRHKNYTEPLKQAIASLPISELGMIAETFLGASHMQKRVRPELETVGGPVDVAVISKGDGFIWIKRKHYFDDKLNLSFKLRYLEQ